MSHKSHDITHNGGFVHRDVELIVIPKEATLLQRNIMESTTMVIILQAWYPIQYLNAWWMHIEMGDYGDTWFLGTKERPEE